MIAKNTPGERIIELRKTYKVERETLAERSGLPLELIRRIEEEGHIPDLAPLMKIARALGVRLGTMLDDHTELGPVITRAGAGNAAPRFITGLPASGLPASGSPNSGSPAPSGGTTGQPNSSPPAPSGGAGGQPNSAGEPKQGLSFHALAADKGGRHMEPFIVDIESRSEQAKSSHEGEEFIYVLSGTVEIEYGADAFRLSPGDSVYYDSIVPHRILPGNAQGTQILAVIYTPA